VPRGPCRQQPAAWWDGAVGWRPAPSPHCCKEGLVGNLGSTAATRSCAVPCRWLQIRCALAKNEFPTGRSLDLATALESWRRACCRAAVRAKGGAKGQVSGLYLPGRRKKEEAAE